MDTPALPAETPVQDLAEEAIRLLGEGGRLRIDSGPGLPLASYSYSGAVAKHVAGSLAKADLLADAASELCETFFTGGELGLTELCTKLFAARWAYMDHRDNNQSSLIFMASAKNGGVPTLFFDSDPPGWLIGGPKGSTMDDRWFFEQHVLTLELGNTVETDFQIITRIA